MPLTPEQYYKNKKWPIIRHPAEKKSIIFSYEDLIDFADSYHLEKIVEAEALGASPVNLVVGELWTASFLLYESAFVCLKME